MYKGSSLIAQNDNWQEGQSLKQFDTISERFLPTRDQEAAFLITRAPGLYTIHLISTPMPKSTPALTGIGLIEVYDMDGKL